MPCCGTPVDVGRWRLGVEGSRRFALSGGGSLTPKLELGAASSGGLDALFGNGPLVSITPSLYLFVTTAILLLTGLSELPRIARFVKSCLADFPVPFV